MILQNAFLVLFKCSYQGLRGANIFSYVQQLERKIFDPINDTNDVSRRLCRVLLTLLCRMSESSM